MSPWRWPPANDAMFKVAVTGASGFIGNQIKTTEPAIGKIEVNFFAQPPFRSNDDKFDDFDVFSTAAAMALSPYNQTDLLWIDMLAATRSGIFPEIDASGSLGYFSELTPFVVPIDKDTEFRERAKAVSRFRSTQPLSGVGLRAIKFCNIERSSSKLLETMSLPQVGINYHASLLYNFNGTMLDLKPVSEWLGPTLDENGIRYRFWFRVSYVGKKLEIVLRYDPRHYTVDDGYQVAGSTIDSLRSFLSC